VNDVRVRGMLIRAELRAVAMNEGGNINVLPNY